MASRGLRKRLHHGDVDGIRKERYGGTSGIESLNEPLLGNHDHNNSHCNQRTLGDVWDDELRHEHHHHHHWTLIFSQLVSQWAQWFASVFFGSGSLIGWILPVPYAIQNVSQNRLLLPSLSPLQEARLRNLQQRLAIPFDGSRLEHQDALKQLWRLAYPEREIPPLKSELWKEMGWQGTDPSTDFRGGGFISLENLIFFGKMYPYSFRRLLNKEEGKRAEWEYPFAVAGINISFMLAQMLDVQSGKPTSSAGIQFLKLLIEDESAFDNLFCVAFQAMDAQWLAKQASYMEFNEVLKSTRSQLETELALDDISTVSDLPAYNLLRR